MEESNDPNKRMRLTSNSQFLSNPNLLTPVAPTRGPRPNPAAPHRGGANSQAAPHHQDGGSSYEETAPPQRGSSHYYHRTEAEMRPPQPPQPRVQIPPPSKLKSEEKFPLWQRHFLEYLAIFGLDRYALENHPGEHQDAICRNAINNAVEPRFHPYIMAGGVLSAHDKWNALKNHCMGVSNAQKQIYRQAFLAFKFDAGEPWSKTESRYLELVMAMGDTGCAPSIYDQKEKILDILPNDYDSIKTKYEFELDAPTPLHLLLSHVRIKATKLGHWHKPRQRGASQAHFTGGETPTNDEGGGRGRGGRSGRGRGRGGRGNGRGGRGNGRGGRGGSEKELVCYRCWETNHYSNKCPNSVKPVPDKYSHLNSRAVIHSCFKAEPDETEDETYLSFAAMSVMEIPCATHESCIALGIDTCASNHMLGDRTLFTNLSTVEPLVTDTACAGSVTAFERGQATFTVLNSDGSTTQVTLEGAYYCPDIAISLLSTTKFCLATGGSVHVTGHGVIVNRHDGSTLFTAAIRCGVPIAHVRALATTAMTCATTVSKADIWHCRMNHADKRILAKMKQHGTVIGLDFPSLAPAQLMFCEGCVAKQASRPFKRTHIPTTRQPGQEWNTDLFGPMRTTSRQKSRYGFIMIDRKSKFVMVAGLRHKGEFPTHLQKCILLLERQFDLNAKSIRADAAGELRSELFHQFLEEKGITLVTSIRDAHQQNGLAERAIRTLTESVVVMLHVAKLPIFLWEYALRFSAHVYNRKAHSALPDGVTPVEMLTGTKPRIQYLRAFGALAWPKKRSQGHDKQRSRSGNAGRLIGYHSDRLGTSPNGYILYYPGENTVSTPLRDIVFDEAPIVESCHETANGLRSQAYPQAATLLDDPSRDLLPSDDDDDDAPDDLPDLIYDDDDDDEHEEIYVEGELPEEQDTPVGPIGTPVVPEPQAVASDPPLAMRRERRGPKPIERLNLVSISRSVTKAMINSSAALQLAMVTFAFYVVFTIFKKEPRTYAQALKREDSAKWVDATNVERKALEDAGTWEITTLPPDALCIPSTIVYKIKQDVNGKVQKYKARLCARGDYQSEGIHYGETYSPVARFATIRMVVALATIMHWTVWQLDVNSAYLYGTIDRLIYMIIPDGFYPKEKSEGKVLKLLKSLYGIKQAGRIWYELLRSFLIDHGFINNSLDRCCFVKYIGKSIIIVLVYVDDLIYTSVKIR